MGKRFKIVICTIIVSGFTSAQIPNNRFEEWTTKSGYYSPNDWGNLNEMTRPYAVFTCGKGIIGNSGNAYLVIKTVSVTGKGLIPGRVVSGKIDTTTYKALAGYPFTARPDNISYSMQYMVSSPNDTAFVSALLTKWNESLLKRDTIAYGVSTFNAMAHEWYIGSTTLTYKSTNKPDSACIVLSSSGTSALNNSYMFIDNLQFNDSGIDINKNNTLSEDVIFYPNPSADNITVNTNPLVSPPPIVSIYNNWGVLIFNKTITEEKTLINVSDWPKGQYSVELKDNKRVVKKLIIK